MKYHTGPMVIYHHVNAYEDEGHVVFDVIAYNDSKLYDMFYLKNLKEDDGEQSSVYSKPSFRRFALPIKSEKVGWEKKTKKQINL